MVSTPSSITKMEHALGGKITDAYRYAAKIHKGQKRKSGESYIMHPVAVAELLFSAGMDRDVVIAALLHDAIEDGEDKELISRHIQNYFGDHVLYLVHAVSKDGKIEDKFQQQEQYLVQIERAFELDVSVFFIKVADIIHNMMTISHLSVDQQSLWMHELLAEYLPLFSSYYHRIPLHEREKYHHLIDRIQSMADNYAPTTSAAVS